MIIYVTGKQIMSNQVIFQRARYDDVIPTSIEYLSDGQNNYHYIFATWNGVIDTAFPPGIQGGTIEVTYWYLPMGTNGIAQKFADVTTLLLGGEGQNGVFVSDNPISSVNGLPWSGGLRVSTASGNVDIAASSTLQMQDFICWVKLWGNCQFSSEHYIVPQNSYCISAAVYAINQRPIPEPHDLLYDLTRRIINPEDLVADYLDERLTKYLDEISRHTGPSVSPDKLSKLLENVKDISPQLAKKALLNVKVEVGRLNAIEKILDVLAGK